MAGNMPTDESRLEKQLESAAPLLSSGSSEGQDATTVRDDEYYPEGGLQAQLTIGASFLVYCTSFSVVNSLGFFQTFYQLDYRKNYSPSTISFIGTL